MIYPVSTCNKFDCRDAWILIYTYLLLHYRSVTGGLMADDMEGPVGSLMSSQYKVLTQVEEPGGLRWDSGTD